MSLLLLSTTIAWFAYTTLRIQDELRDIKRTIGAHGRVSDDVMSLQTRYQFLTFITVSLFLALGSSLVLWYVGVAPLPGNNTPEFVSLHVFINVYTLTLIHAFTPQKYKRLRYGDDDLFL